MANGNAVLVQSKPGPLSERFVKTVEEMSPVVPLVASLIWGMALILLSFALHPLDSFPVGTKTFGWVSEYNWSSTFGFFVPLSLFFSSLAITSIPQVITSLAQGKMIRRADGTVVDSTTLIKVWRSRAKNTARLAAVLAGAGLVISWIMAWTYCVQTSPSFLPSWQRAILLGVPGVNRLEVYLLGFLAYTSQGIAIACFCYYVLMIFTFATWIQDYTKTGDGDALYPDISDSDVRCGFERLEPVVNGILLASVAYFCQFFMTRLYFIYVDDLTASSMFDVVKEALGRDFGRDVKELITASGASFFNYGSGLHFQSTIMGFAMLIVAVSAIIVPTVLVQNAAQRSRVRLGTAIGDDPGITMRWYKLDLITAKERLKKMTIWPIRYPRPVGLLLLTILATVCFFCYQLLLFVLALIIAQALRYFATSLKQTTQVAVNSPGTSDPQDRET